MKKEHFKHLLGLLAILSMFYVSYQWNQSRKLDEHYFDRLKLIKSRMVHGSSADTLKELNDYQDQTELCMHLDGYNGLKIMELRIKAFQAAMQE
jgi:hypothetical protein